MLNLIFAVIVCIALFFSLFIGIFALFRSQSYKKNYFLLMQAMVIVYLLGYLLEITSTNTEEAYAAVKILYLGSSFVSVFALFFIADYCNIKLPLVFIRIPMLIISSVITLLMWTTKFHKLVYIDYIYETTFVHNLAFTPGPAYTVFHIYQAVCMFLVMVLLLYQLKKWESKYRKRHLILFFCVAIPFITEIIYFISIMTGLNKYHVYFTPVSMAIMSYCLYLGIMRFNIFEIISIATVSAMEHIREGFILVDENDNYLFSNPAAVKILPGITRLKIGESIFSAVDWPHELDDMGNDIIEFTITDESDRYFRASVSPVFAKNMTLMAKIVLIRDVTDSIKLMLELKNAAYIDALTGLYNRKHFIELASVDIERALRLKQSLYTAMLDLDFFKNVNDSYGHAAGDLVLKTTAGIIRQTIRAYDLLCRYGGEEFVLLITDLDAPEAFNLMERIRENMEITTINYEGTEINVTCSIGLAKFIEDDTLESSIKKSDEALYNAKNSGRNLVKVFGS